MYGMWYGMWRGASLVWNLFTRVVALEGGVQMPYNMEGKYKEVVALEGGVEMHYNMGGKHKELPYILEGMSGCNTLNGG